MTTPVTPWPSLNTYLKLEPGSLIVLTGPGSSGVSMAGLNIAIHAAFEQQIPVAVVSKEMDSESTFERIIANRTGIDSTRFDKPDSLTDEDWQLLNDFRENHENAPLTATHEPKSIEDVIRMLDEHQRLGTSPCLVLVDGLEYLAPRRTSVALAGPLVAPSLKAVARRYGVVIVATVHLDDERFGRPTLECGLDVSTAAAADQVLYLEQAGPGKLLAEALKGDAPLYSVTLDWQPQCSRIIESDRAQSGMVEVGVGMEDTLALLGAPGRLVETPWEPLTVLLGLARRRKAGIVAQRGTHEATVGRRIAAHAAQEGPVLLFSSYPPADAPESLVIDPAPTPGPRDVAAAVEQMRLHGQSPRLIVVERYERMKLKERPDDVDRWDELQWGGEGKVWEEGCMRLAWRNIACPILFTTVVDGEPKLEKYLADWAGVNSSAMVLTDFCDNVVILRRRDENTVQAQTLLDDTINKWILHEVDWPLARGARRIFASTATEAPAAPVAIPKPARASAAQPTLIGAIQALETEYAGHRFRSRLEARWAVGLDALGVQWEYEPQRYQLPSGKYLPDFWLPQQRCFLEVKGLEPSDSYRVLLEELAAGTGHRVILAVGSIPNPDRFEIGGQGDPFWLEATDLLEDLSVMWAGWQAWCRCPTCGAFDVTLEGRISSMFCGCGGAGSSATDAEVLAGYRAARMARFEHGEFGA